MLPMSKSTGQRGEGKKNGCPHEGQADRGCLEGRAAVSLKAIAADSCRVSGVIGGCIGSQFMK